MSNPSDAYTTWRLELQNACKEHAEAQRTALRQRAEKVFHEIPKSLRKALAGGKDIIDLAEISHELKTLDQLEGWFKVLVDMVTAAGFRKYLVIMVVSGSDDRHGTQNMLRFAKPADEEFTK